MRYLFGFSLLLFLFSLPIPPYGRVGAFNVFSRLAYCPDVQTCYHEIGHALDKQSDWISQSKDFEKAIEFYLYVELKKDKIEYLPAAIIELTYRGNTNNHTIRQEIYAFLFQYARGKESNMPVIFRDFYNWTLAHKYIDMLNNSQTMYYFN